MDAFIFIPLSLCLALFFYSLWFTYVLMNPFIFIPPYLSLALALALSLGWTERWRLHELWVISHSRRRRRCRPRSSKWLVIPKSVNLQVSPRMNLSFWRAVGILEKSCLSVHICIYVYPFLYMCKQRDKHYLLSVHLFLAICMLMCIKKSVKSATSAYNATVYMRFTVRRHHCGIHSGSTWA